MRILLIHNNYTVYGGADVFIHEVARVLQDHGNEVAFLCSQDERADTKWAIYFPAAADYRGSLAKAIRHFPQMVYSRGTRAAARKLIGDFSPDIAHCFSTYTKLTPSVLDELSRHNVPIVASFNDYKHICPNYKLFHHGHVCEECEGRKFYRAIVNRCAHDSRAYSVASAIEAYVHRFLNIYRKNIHTFLFASEFMAKKTEQFWGAGSFRWKILRNPFDVTGYTATGTDGEYVLFFGRLAEEKGVDVLLEAASRSPDIPFVIVGDGPDFERLTATKKQLRLENVTFVGAKWGQELNEYLNNCRFVVVPSVWHENFPYVILQSFASGRAVIGASRGGIPELVADGERGLTYDATDSGMLANAVSRLWGNPELARSMGRQAKQYIDAEFSDTRFYDCLLQIYSEALN